LADPIQNNQIDVQVHKFSDYTLEEQVTMAANAAVYVTSAGGGAITASFLPRGASLHILYNERGGVENNRNTRLPARLDWDFFNNQSYLRVHWIPSGARQKADKDAAVDLILYEVQRIYQERVRNDSKNK